MPAEGMEWLPRSRAAHLRGDRAGRPGVRRPLRHRLDPADRRRADRAGRACPSWSASWPRLGVDVALTTNGSTLAAMARPLAEAGLRRINISLRLAARRALRRAHPARRPPRPVLDRHRRRHRGRARPGEAQRRPAAGRQRGRGRRLRRVRPGQGRRRALHRVHAARRRRRLDDAARSCPAGRSSPPSTPCTRSSRCAATTSRRPAGAIVDGAGRDRRDPDSVTEPFCAACDRIRLTADGRLRACLFAIDEVDLRPVLRGGGDDDGPGRAGRGHASRRRGRATRSGRSRSSGPADRCRQIGG